MSAILELEGLSKRFGGLSAVDNLSFKVEPGKITRMSGVIETLDFQDVRKAGNGALAPRQYVAETRDGLVVKITPVGDLGENWVRIEVSSKAEASAEQAKALSATVSGRDFRIAGYQVEMFGWTMSEMTSEQKS